MKYRNYLVNKRYICYVIKQFTHKSAWWSKSYRFVPSAQGIPLSPRASLLSLLPPTPQLPRGTPRSSQKKTVRTLQPLASSSELSPLRGKCGRSTNVSLVARCRCMSIFPGKYIPTKKHEITGPATVQTPAWSLRHNVRPRSEGKERGREK